MGKPCAEEGNRKEKEKKKNLHKSKNTKHPEAQSKFSFLKCSSPAALRTFRAVNNLSCTWLGTAWAEGFSYLPDPGSERWSWQKPWEMWVCRISYCGAERKKDQSFPPAGNRSSLQGGTHTLVLGLLSHFMCGSLTHLLQEAIMESNHGNSQDSNIFTPQ